MKPWKSFVLLAVMFPAGCAADGEETSGEVPPSAPDVTAIADGQEHDLSFVTSTWNVELPEGEQQTIQTDGTGLQAVADDPSQVEADSGNSVDIRFENGRNRIKLLVIGSAGKNRKKLKRLKIKRP